MARLSDLPRELTVLILSFLLLDDIETFTSMCRKIYNLAAKEIETFRALKRKHAVYRFCNPYGSSSRRNISQVSEDILQEPKSRVCSGALDIFVVAHVRASGNATGTEPGL